MTDLFGRRVDFVLHIFSVSRALLGGEGHFFILLLFGLLGALGGGAYLKL